MEYLKEPCNLEIFVDSKYVKNGIESWIKNWKKNGWKTANKKTVKNKDLWMTLDKLSSKHNIKWCWVKAHNGDPLNEEADRLARKAIEENI